MRAVRFHGREDIRVDEVEEPTCGEDQVKIRPAFNGICGSDIHEYLTGPRVVPLSPHPLTGEVLPTTLGHEISGIVEEVGAKATKFKVGEQIVVKPNLVDGTCSSCSRGMSNVCVQTGFIGFSGKTGGLSDHIVVGAEHVFSLPDSVPLDIGALVEPLAVAWRAVSRIPLQANDSALVVGCGPIGLAIIQVLKVKGITSIIAVEPAEIRRQCALALGASATIDPIEVDLVAQVMALTGGTGAAVAFECSSVQQRLDTAVAGLRVGGTAVVVSFWTYAPDIDAFAVVFQEKHITGSAMYHDSDFEAVIEAIASGTIQPRPMISDIIRLEDVDEKGFKALVGERDKHVKILVDISA